MSGNILLKQENMEMEMARKDILYCSNSTNRSLQMWFREKHLNMHKSLNLKVDGLKQQKTTLGSICFGKEQHLEAIIQ